MRSSALRACLPAFTLLWALLAAGPAAAGQPLFETHEALEIGIPLDFKQLCRPREDPGCDYVPTRLDYGAPDGPVRSLPIEIKVRGGWRSLTRNCSAPLLWLRFDPQTTAGTARISALRKSVRAPPRNVTHRQHVRRPEAEVSGPQ